MHYTQAKINAVTHQYFSLNTLTVYIGLGTTTTKMIDYGDMLAISNLYRYFGTVQNTNITFLRIQEKAELLNKVLVLRRATDILIHGTSKCTF